MTFQFLHGAIKGDSAGANKATDMLFQFLHGAIKGPAPVIVPPVDPDFNSYMVRLRVNFYPVYLDFVAISIPTWCD